MPSRVWTSGALRVTHPDSYTVASAPMPGRTVSPRRTRQGGPAGLEAGGAEDVTAALLDSLAAQDLELVEPVELAPAAAPKAGARGVPRASRPATVSLDLEVAADEGAVVLLEQDGCYAWQLPTARAAPQRAVSLRGEAPTTRVVHFDLDVRAAEPLRRTAPPTRALRGPLGDHVVGKVTAHVLKFVAGLVPGPLIAFLERDVRPGLVVMAGTDVRAWRRVSTLADLDLPTSRAARILLFVHGTFSTTVGDYGQFTLTPAGRALLEAANGAYDAVLGFDHPTLSRDPLENATDLLARLEAQRFARTPLLDVVSYSRGGLVARSLVESLLPSTRWRADVRRMVFIGATNAGTGLAEPENWDQLVDLYTNLAAGTARAIGALSATAPAGEVVRAVLRGLGTFVKFLAAASVTERRVPGLAAMEPDGPFVTELNRTQPGQPAPGTPWYAVSSDFEPRLVADPHQPPELPARFVAALADGLVDRLLGTANDLVVDTASMTAVDVPEGGGFIRDTLAFGRNGEVHHLNYFLQARVCEALVHWLEPRRRRTGGRPGPSP